MLEASTYAVVWRFLGDLHVMDVGFGHTGAGDPHELWLGTHFVDVGATGVAHRGTQAAHRTHAAVSLVRTALEQFDLARGFFSTGEHRAHHPAGSTGDDGLGQVTGEPDTAVGDQR